jgi:hypothetical protein
MLVVEIVNSQVFLDLIDNSGSLAFQFLSYLQCLLKRLDVFILILKPLIDQAYIFEMRDVS